MTRDYRGQSLFDRLWKNTDLSHFIPRRRRQIEFKAGSVLGTLRFARFVC